MVERAVRAERTETACGYEEPAKPEAGVSSLLQTFSFRLEKALCTRKLREPGASAPIRLARLLVLAYSVERAIRDGTTYRDYADAARSLRITRARLTQIINLTFLAPEIQEEILFMSTAGKGEYSIHPINERALRWVAGTADWSEQKKRWEDVKGDEKRGSAQPVFTLIHVGTHPQS